MKQMARPPVVVVMGHIDHGKSTLLDYIRKTNVVATEAGGITQHVNAYEINIGDARTALGVNRLTFIDTPGHEAFSNLRGRGAAAADIAILVVSAEDGVKPQTLEAKKIIDEQNLPYLIAINKIDKSTANLERTKQNLLENNFQLEGLGGHTPWVAISAKTGEGIKDLLDLLFFIAEMAELTKDDAITAEGYILEVKADPRKGTVATVILKNGTLHRGDYLATPGQSFRVRKLEDFLGRDLAAAAASSPVTILGWKNIPTAGTLCRAFKNEKEIKEWLNSMETPISRQPPVAAEGNIILPLVIKTDTSGTLEAVKKELLKIASAAGGDNKLRLLTADVGWVNENDVKIASVARQTVIIGFNVGVEKSAEELIEKQTLTLKVFNLIYELSEWLTEEIKRRQPVKIVEEIAGEAKIIKIFNQEKHRRIIGGLVLAGRVAKGHSVRITRRGHELGEGKIIELRQKQNKVTEVKKGEQFGALIESRIALTDGDQLIALTLVDTRPNKL